MKTKIVSALSATLIFLALPDAAAADGGKNSNWSIDLGIRWFKYSAEGKPGEIDVNPVFDRWERINQDRENYAVGDYEALKPLYFNFSYGADVFVRWRKYLMLKLGYDYSNPAGIGGDGRIEYTDGDGSFHAEKKSFSYTSHQINLFIGPVVPVEDIAEIYLGFAPFAPTWVNYEESYSHEIDGVAIEDYDRALSGFFGNCRLGLGIQIRVWKGLKLGGEAVYSFFNFMKLSGGDLADHSFQFPAMKWNFTVRYGVL